MNNLYLHNLNNCEQDRIDDITIPIIEFFEEKDPTTVKIIDPYFDVESFQYFLNNYSPNKPPKEISLWIFLFDELLKIDSLEEIYIITTKSFKNFMRNNTKLFFLKVSHNGYLYTCNRKDFRFLYYANPGNSKINHKNNTIPDLHDRWILLCNDNNIQGLHIGSSLNDSFGKDLTITKFNSEGAQMANQRYVELVKFSEERVKW